MSLIGDLAAVLGGETHEEADKLAYGEIANVTGWDGHEKDLKILPGTRYFQLYLEEMWLKYDREWLSRYYPLAYTVVKMHFGDSEVELPATIGEFKLDGKDLSNLSKALRLNYAMTPPVPYNGGLVEIDAALVAMRSSDGLEDAIKAVGKFSELLMLPQLSSAIAVASPFAETLNVLIGHSRERFELGLHQSLKHEGQEELREGYFLAANVDEPLDFNTLMVHKGRLAWAPDPTQLVREFNYMLFRLETYTERDDYDGLNVIYGPMKEAEAAVTLGVEGMTKAKALVASAKVAAWRSPDLTRADRKRLPLVLQQQFDEFLTVIGAGGSGAGLDASRTAKDAIPVMMEKIGSAEEALAIPDDDIAAELLEV